MLRFVTRNYRPIAVFGGTTLVVSVLFSMFLWLFASRWSDVPFPLAMLGGLTAGLLAVVTDRRVSLPSPATVPQRRSSLSFWQVFLAWSAVFMLGLIFPETISAPVQIGLVLGVSGLYYGLYYARQHLTSAGVDQRTSLARRFTLHAVKGLMWAVIALEVGLWLLIFVHLKAPCSVLDLPRRRQGCVVAFDQVSYPLQITLSKDASLVITGDADGVVYVWSANQRALVRRLEVPNQRVVSLALSQDQQVVAGGFRDGTIRLWRIADGSLLHTLSGHTERVNELVFAPDGQTVASASDDRTVRIWQLGTSRPPQTLAHPDHVGHVALTPDGASLISAYDDTILVWNIQQGTVTRELVFSDWIMSMTVSPDGQTIAAGLNDLTVRLWRSAHESSERLAELRERVDVLAFSSDGAQLLTSTGDGDDVRIWQVADGAFLRTVQQDHIEAVRFTPQQLTLVTNSLDAVFVWQR